MTVNPPRPQGPLAARTGGDYLLRSRPTGGRGADRVVVFLDYQNAYHGARAAFHEQSAPYWAGQVDPRQLGDLLISKSARFRRRLQEVRVYRGQPDPRREPRAFSAFKRQCASWQGVGGTTVIVKPLQYPRAWPREKAREKGVDVALAIDFVAMAVRREFDVGILFSTDTDLKPALEFVYRLGNGRMPRCEVAAWSGEGVGAQRLTVPGTRLWCHWLGRSDYEVVADERDYVVDGS